ncbi:MAG: aminoacyl-histidine dipeptidase [Holophagaceae bacterium]|nr:aminoacyl-histidine dipeptidase [Holophagaceae bacterium]
MDALLQNPETKLLWNYFLELCKIPHGSKKEAAAANWVAEQGRALGLETIQDEVGNVVIRKPATPGYENLPGFILQAHVDMVCEKNEDTAHDFEKDPIKLQIKGDHLYAVGTTLGADNGVGVCAGLAVLASKDLKHPQIEVLVTIDEEMGLNGANFFKGGILTGKYFLNLDSEEEGFLTIGCAGGIDTEASKKVALVAPSAGSKGFRLKVSGLKGGHSGIDINNCRGNAIRILARTLYALQKDTKIGISSLKGGNKRNAIPREANAILAVQDEAKAKSIAAAVEAETKQAIGKFDPDLRIALEPVDLPSKVIADNDATAIVNTLFTMIHGVVAMNPDIAGLVQTSTNLGVLDTQDDVVSFYMLHRSSIDASKMTVVDRVTAHCALGGFKAVHIGGYPGWKPEPDSDLVKLINGVHKEAFGKDMEIVAIHAGLECGIIGEKYPGMQMVSIGPDMWDVHTPEEHVSIPSVANFWKFLLTILAKN